VYYKAKKKALNNNQVYHIAAILRRKKQVIKIGVNSEKTHPKYKRFYEDDGSTAACMHAEMSVLRFAKPGDTLEVMRFPKKGGAMTMAKPCHLCEAAIQEAQIKQVKYTDWNGNWVTVQY